jgi:tripartite-type tricarboxylate transporter receptor subunit TctC
VAYNHYGIDCALGQQLNIQTRADLRHRQPGRRVGLHQVPLTIGSVFLVNPHVTSGRLRVLAVTSAKPDPSLPGVETIAAQGVPGFEAYTWWGLFAPGNMPAPLAKRIYDELSKAINAAAVREKLLAPGIDVKGAPGDQLDDFVRKEMARWAKVIKDNNIKSGD